MENEVTMDKSLEVGVEDTNLKFELKNAHPEDSVLVVSLDKVADGEYDIIWMRRKKIPMHNHQAFMLVTINNPAYHNEPKYLEMPY